MQVYLRLHIAAAYISYIIFFVASAAAVLYFVQDNAIKNKKRGVIFSRLPSLSFLDKLNYRSIGLAFPILTFSIFCAFCWYEKIHGIHWPAHNSRLVFFIVIWLIYAIILHMRLSAKMRGRKVALLSIVAFFVIILSLFGACP